MKGVQLVVHMKKTINNFVSDGFNITHVFEAKLVLKTILA